MNYHHLTTTERGRIEILHAERYTVREVAKHFYVITPVLRGNKLP